MLRIIQQDNTLAAAKPRQAFHHSNLHLLIIDLELWAGIQPVVQARWRLHQLDGLQSHAVHGADGGSRYIRCLLRGMSAHDVTSPRA